jgi:hypothetical protein
MTQGSGKSKKKIKTDLFNQGRICKYCGVNMDTTDMEALRFFHATCWQQYRINNEVYPFPKNYRE